MQTLTPDFAEALELPVDRGVLIGRLVRNGPADRAGLRGGTARVIVGNTRLVVGGDIIVEVDGRRVASAQELQRLLRTKKPGERLRLTVARGGRTRSITVTLGERPRV